MSPPISYDMLAMELVLPNIEHFDRFDISRLNGLPKGVLVEVAMLDDPQHTVDLASRLAGEGYKVGLHYSARAISSESALIQHTRQLINSGVDRIFVLGGSRESYPDTIGPYKEALDVLEVMDGLGLVPVPGDYYRDEVFEEVGMATYLDGIPGVTNESLKRSYLDKLPYVTDATTCQGFDPVSARDHIRSFRHQTGFKGSFTIGTYGIVNESDIGSSPPPEYLKNGYFDAERFLRTVLEFDDIEELGINRVLFTILGLESDNLERTVDWIMHLNES